MISKVAPPTTEATSVAPPAGGDAGDSGVFDVLLTLQSQATADAAAVNPPPGGALDGTDVLAGLLDDSSDDPTRDEADPADDALWFLGAVLPAPKVPLTAAVAEALVAARLHHDAAVTAAAPQTAAQAGSTTDLAQAFAFGPATADAGDSPTAAPPTQAQATPVNDPANWNSLTGPAEFFAQSRQGTVERAESAHLATHVRDPRWVDDLGHRLASMVRTGESSASLQLTPADLGPLEVNVAVRDNQATVHFGAANAETRALLEASMPRLREMLASQGFHLMDSSVSHGFARQTRHESAGTPRVDAVGESPTVTAQPIYLSGLLDLYA